MTSRAHAPDRTFHSFPSVEEQTAFVPVVFGELTSESLARSYAEMRERIRREIVSAFGQPLVLGVPVDAPAPTPGENAFGFVVPPGTMLVVTDATLRQQADLIMERVRTARHCLDRDVITVPAGMPSLRHPIMADVSTIRYDPDASPEFSASRVCETRQGEPICACGRYGLTWSRAASEITVSLARKPFGVDAHRAVEGDCDDIPGADDARAEASTLRDAGVPAVRVDEYQRRLSSLLGGRRLV